MKKKYKPAVLIHIKLNSQRLKVKNLKKIGKKPLYQLTFDKLSKYKNIFDVYVHSSSSLIEKISRDYKFKFLSRPKKLDLPNAQGNELISNCIKRIENKIIIQLFVTNPFIEILTLKKIYKLLINNSKIDSVTPVYPIYNRLWYKKKPINHKYHKLIGTQFMEPVLLESGLYCFRQEIFKK
jgi:CMP-N-acetylneuraminic acid synthetase